VASEGSGAGRVDAAGGSPLELELEAGKQHTFMLRPPVALAHLHGIYFDTNKCFLLPSARRSLKRLVRATCATKGARCWSSATPTPAGTEADNLTLSGERAMACAPTCATTRTRGFAR